MLQIAIVMFLLAAFAGSFIAYAIFKNRPTPKPVVFLHGTLAFMGLLILITYVVSYPTSTLLLTSLIMFVLAAIGGLTMFTIDMSGKPVPKLFAVLHPLLAIASLILLIIYVLQLQDIIQ